MIIRFFRWLVESPERVEPAPLKAASPPPPKPHYRAPSGKEIRHLLRQKVGLISQILNLTVVVDKQKYSIVYTFTHSAWYSVAYTLNHMKMPSLTCFVRGKQPPSEMAIFIKAELVRKKKARLLRELRQRRMV